MTSIVNPQNSNHKVRVEDINMVNKYDKVEHNIVVGGTLTSGSAVVSVQHAPELSAIAVGMGVVGAGIPDGTTVLSKDPVAKTFTLSANATVSGGSTLTIGNIAYVLAFGLGSRDMKFIYATSGARDTAYTTVSSQIG